MQILSTSRVYFCFVIALLIAASEFTRPCFLKDGTDYRTALHNIKLFLGLDHNSGGGAALALNPEKFSLSKLNIAVPKPLEIVWGLMRPIEPTGVIRKIILCSFYSPPNSKKNNLLIDHISITYNTLKLQHPTAGTLICGDKNNLDEKRILAIDPNFQQIVTQNTRKNKILSIIITDLISFYNVPQIVPPVPVDIPGRGVPSDHNGVLGVPISHETLNRKSQARTVKVRPMPESLIKKFGSILVKEDWSYLTPEMSSTGLVEAFESHTANLVQQTFPEKTCTVSDRDLPYITEELKILRRQRMRIYSKEGRSTRYLAMKALFKTKLCSEAEKYRVKIMDDVASGKLKNSYAALKKLEFGSIVKAEGFTLPSHYEENLSPAQSAERLAEYFSRISQEFEPINKANLPPYVKEKLRNGKEDPGKPVLQDWQVYNKLQKSKKPNSMVPGDLPVKLVKEFTPELAKPVAIIYNKITETAEYPRQWVVEYQLAIPKVTPPLSEDDLRNIAGTAFLSKQYE